MFEKIDCPPAVAATLSAQVKSSTVAGAYIFAGPDKEIKYQTALEFVRALNCRSGGSAGCSCESCLRPLPQTLLCVKKTSAPQDSLCEPFLIREAKSNKNFLLVSSDKSLGIELCRYLIHFMARKSERGVFKAAIIRESELLTEEAANSLLKILEEPPPDCVVILISPASHSLLPTIRSRSQILRFPPGRQPEPMPAADAELWRKLARLRDGRHWRDLFEALRKFHAVSAGKNKTAASLRREKTRVFIEGLLREAASRMRKDPSEKLSGEIEYMDECCQMLKKQRMPNVVLSRMLFRGIPSFLED